MTMNPGKEELKNPTRRIPDLRLAPVAGGSAVPVRARGRMSTVLLLRHHADCLACDEYTELLASRGADISDWDGRVLVVVAESDVEGLLFETPAFPTFPTVIDQGNRLANALNAQAPALAVTDRWGEIHLMENAGAEHRFPSADEVVSWLRYLAIQCPECQGEAF
jgi:hypothetical protein